MSDATGTKPDKYSARYWSKETTQAQERRRDFREQADRSIKVYNAKHKHDGVSRQLNVWWYVVNTLLPAYYSSTPKVEANLRKSAGAMPYQLAAVLLERNSQYALDEYFDFPLVGLQSALQFLLTGESVLWSRYEADIGQKSTEIALLRDPAGGLVDQDGNPYDAQGMQLVEGDGGAVIATMQGEQKTDERAILDLVKHTDYLTNDARDESEVEWRARRAYLDRDKAEAMFGRDVASSLSFNMFPEHAKRTGDKDSDTHEGKAELWEIWCEASGKVYWTQNNGDKSVVESGPPPIKFAGFYPCVVMAASVSPESNIPVSDFTHAEDQIMEVERLTTRIHGLIQAVRANFAYDASLTHKIEELLTGDLRGIPITNWPSYKSRGGLASALEFLPVGNYTQALEVLMTARQQALEQLYETLKVSDLLRGVSEPTKTATANRLESQWSSLGLIVRQNQFARFIGEAIGKLAAIIGSKFSDAKILEVGDAQNLFAQAVQDPMQAQRLQAEVMRIIRSEVERCYRIEVASDSMVALDQRQERQDGVDLMASAGSFFQQLTGIIEQFPPALQMGLSLFQYTLRLYRGGKEMEPVFMNLLQSAAQYTEQKAQEAANAPQDPKLVEAQTRMQIAQLEAQSASERAQMEMEVTRAKAQAEIMKSQAEMLHREKELEIKMMELQLKLVEVQAQSAAEQATAAANQLTAELKTITETQKVEIEQMRTRIEAFEAQTRAVEGMAEERHKREQLEFDKKQAAKEPKGEARE